MMDKQYKSETNILHVTRTFTEERPFADALRAYLTAVIRTQRTEVRDDTEQ